MSYDLTIAAHRKPTPDVIEAWASEQGFEVIAAADGHSFTIQQPGRRDTGYICEVWGPDPAEPEDFDEELAAACLSPNWISLQPGRPRRSCTSSRLPTRWRSACS